MDIIRDNTSNKVLNWAICIAVIANLVVFSSFSSLLISSISNNEPETGEILRVVRAANPVTMDPLNSWDSISNDMIDQVAEPLLATDITDPAFPIVGRLAECWEWIDNTTIEFTLREDVFFHDGQRLTGEDVIHTFERINHFGNWTGTLEYPDVMAFPHSLYKFRDGIPIFNDTLSRAWWDANKAIDPLIVRLYLNRPFSPVEGLLGYTASYIVGQSTPKYDMLELVPDLLIGTGPFKLIRYIPNSEIRFARWERYWRTGAYWDQIIYVFYRSYTQMCVDMSNGDVDWLGQIPGGIKTCVEPSSELTITGDGVHDYINGSIYWYIAFNSEIINQTWRKAISHTFNYTYLIEEIEENTVVRASSLVPPGFPAHNSSTKGAHYDIPLARIIMQSMGYGVGWEVGIQVGDIFTPGADEALWQAAAWTPNVGNFTNNDWNFRHNIASTFMADLIQRFGEDMDLIGINIVPQILTWSQFIQMSQDHPERLHIYFVGWGPDYFEPFNMIDPLVNNASDSNYARINDPYLQDLLAKTVAETDTAARYLLCQQLQGYIIDVQSYHMPLMYDKIYHIHASSLKGFPYNCMRLLYWYPTYRE